MTPALILALLLALFVALVLATPQARAFIKLGFRMRQDEREDRRPGRAENPQLDAFHDAKGATNELRTELDERTWIDLDLDQVFSQVDYTLSRPGQQYLRHLLRTPCLHAEPIAQLNGAITQLESEPDTETTVRAALEFTDDRRAGFLATLFYGELPDRPRYWFVFPLLTASAIVFAALIFVWPRALLGLIAIATINICLQLFYRPRVEALIPAIHEIPAFFRTARMLGRLRTDLFTNERQTLAEGFTKLKVLQSATAWLKYEPSEDANQLFASMYLYVNMLLLLDLNAFVFGLKSAKQARPTLQRMFEAIGLIDVTQSISAWRKTLPLWSTPTFTTAQKEIRVTGVAHPLITNAVANDVRIDGSSALITGSNMSGKTTFIRALGLNAIFAQSLGTVIATSWHAPLLHVSTSIGRSDSVLEGRSYYLAEVESIRTLIEQKGDGAQHLFLIDELFRGTNTTERVAGAYAVLEYLNRGNDIVVVATHDTELLGMLGSTYAPHHFREEIADGTLTFDFRLRDGQATTRNAIALLELMKYPAEVVARARDALR